MRESNYADFTTMRPPKYPAPAFDAGIEGFVELQMEVDPGGVPQHIAVVRARRPVSSIKRCWMQRANGD